MRRIPTSIAVLAFSITPALAFNCDANGCDALKDGSDAILPPKVTTSIPSNCSDGACDALKKAMAGDASGSVEGRSEGTDSADPVVTKFAMPDEASGHHEEFCTNEWTKRGILDRNMYDYCLREEHEGYADLIDLTNQQASKIDDYNSMLASMIAKWTNRDMRRDQMVAFEMKEQVESYKDMVYFQNQKDYSDSTMKACLGSSYDWYTGAIYCYKHEMHIGND